MSRVAVVTDTTQYLPREVIERHGIELVSLYVNWDGRTDREIDLPDYDGYYDFLRSAGELPTTSQPSLGDFLAVYEPLVERGADLAGALAAARAMRENLKIIVMVDTLEYLRRGGRIGAAAAWIGATLKVKPILTIEGEMQPVERVRTAGRAFERLVAHLEQRREDGCDGFAIQHIQARGEAERLAERGREIYGRDPELISEIGPVIGTHTGPGILGVTGLRTDLLGPM